MSTNESPVKLRRCRSIFWGPESRINTLQRKCAHALRRRQRRFGEVVISFVMYLCPVIVCKNPGCESQPIRLPYPNPPKTFADRPEWPKADWKASVACLECGNSYIYTAQDVHWGSFESQELGRRKSWVKYVLQCAHKDCGLPIEFYMCVVSTIEPETLWSRILGVKERPACQKNHGLTSDAVFVSTAIIEQIESS
jgi:hypothetical protein